MNEAIRRKRIGRRKRIIKVWLARAAVLLAAGLIIFGIALAIKTLVVNASDNDELEEITTEMPTETEVPTETEMPTETEVPAEPEAAGTKFQDLHPVDWSSDEAYMLAKIAMAEAEGESIEGKAMVIMVVLNRVHAEGFGNTIEDVIFEHHTNSKGKEVYQFTPVQPGGRWYRVEPDADCWKALRMIEMEQWDESEGALYFEAVDREEGWHRNNLEYIKTVGNHNFYK